MELPKLEPTREMPNESQEPFRALLEMVSNSLSKLTEENRVKSLWEEVRRENVSKDNKGKAPIVEVDLDNKQACIDLVTSYTNTKPNSSSVSKALSLNLPSQARVE